MADEQPSLQIDTDWKKQAQEEKRRLAEKAAEAKSAAPAAGTAPSAAPSAASRRSAERETPPASMSTLVQQMMTQALFYLGDIAYRGQPPMVDLDMARHQHDLLTMLEEKTANNLNEDERKMLDTALHEVRTRFIRTASEYLNY
jgi:hypothetical protein